MNFMAYIEQVYPYGTPIFLKNVRIGGMSKNAVKQCFYRAAKQGLIVREASGIYSRKDDGPMFANPIVTFERVVEDRFLYAKGAPHELREMFVIGYYSGITFQNMIHITNQVPAVLDITTNNTSGKRLFSAMGREAILRKPKTEITFQNWKELQFLDVIAFTDFEEVEERSKEIINYARKVGITQASLTPYLKLYPMRTLKKLFETEIWNEITRM